MELLYRCFCVLCANKYSQSGFECNLLYVILNGAVCLIVGLSMHCMFVFLLAQKKKKKTM